LRYVIVSVVKGDAGNFNNNLRKEVFEKFKGQPLRLKHKLTIEIKGVITHLNEPFAQYEFLFFSPLSVA